MGSFKYFFLILCCISPILDAIFGGISEGARYMPMAGIATAVNAVLFAGCYITRKHWSKWITDEYHKVLGTPKEGEQEPADSLMIILMGVDWLIFACLVPYGFYKESTIDSNWLLLTVFFAFMLWGELYQMRYHLVLSGSARETVKLARLPIVTLGVGIWGYLNFETFASINELIVLVAGIFLVEIAVDMAVRVIMKRVLKLEKPEPVAKKQPVKVKPVKQQKVKQRIVKNSSGSGKKGSKKRR